MPWQLIAEGHALGEKEEKKLFRLLGKLFGNDDYGAAGPVRFAGDHISGNPMSDDDLATAKSVGDSDDDEPKAALVPKGEPYPAVTAALLIPEEGRPGEEAELKVHPGTGEVMQGVEHPADGTMSTSVINEADEGEHGADDVGNRD